MSGARPCLALAPLTRITRWGVKEGRRQEAATATSAVASKVRAGIVTPWNRLLALAERGQLDGALRPQSGLSESGEGGDTRVIHCWV